jgi:hypothetical protein
MKESYMFTLMIHSADGTRTAALTFSLLLLAILCKVSQPSTPIVTTIFHGGVYECLSAVTSRVKAAGPTGVDWPSVAQALPSQKRLVQPLARKLLSHRNSVHHATASGSISRAP